MTQPVYLDLLWFGQERLSRSQFRAAGGQRGQMWKVVGVKEEDGEMDGVRWEPLNVKEDVQ